MLIRIFHFSSPDIFLRITPRFLIRAIASSPSRADDLYAAAISRHYLQPPHTAFADTPNSADDADIRRVFTPSACRCQSAIDGRR